jgi:hypothetical protein
MATATTLVAVALVAATAFAREERLSARIAFSRGDAHAAERHAGRAARAAPWDVDAAVLEASVRSGAAGREPTPDALAEALRLADRAVALSPVRPGAREVRATLRWRSGDLPGAWADLVVASRLHPVRAEYARARDRLATALRGATPESEGGR